MNNPLRSERDAFRMVLVTIVYFGLIGIGWKIERWLGGAVFVVLTVGGIVWLVRGGRRETPSGDSPTGSSRGDRRILVVADESVGSSALRDELRRRTGSGRTVVLVVCPATDSPGDDRLPASLVAMRAVGVDATGEIGDADPMQAIEDALGTFRADELVVSTLPRGRSRWLEQGVVERARERFDLPLTHVVVESNGSLA
jgi:GABA permease